MISKFVLILAMTFFTFVSNSAQAGFGAVDSLDNIYQGYWTYYESPTVPSPGIDSWGVKKSSDGGMTWTVVDYFTNEQGHAARPYGMVVGPQDEIYVVGTSGGHSYDKTAWLIRKSTDYGQTWTNSGTFCQGVGGEAQSIVMGNDGALYVAGTCVSTTTDLPYWVVIKSADQGATWQVVDQYTDPNGNPTYIYPDSITKDNEGNLYVAGRSSGLTTDQISNWILRKSSNGGQTWSTIQYYADPQMESGSYAQSIASDGTRIYALCSGFNSTAQSILRTTDDAGQTWSTLTESSLNPSKIIWVGPTNSLFMLATVSSGNTSDTSTILRRSSDKGLTWQTVFSQITGQFVAVDDVFSDATGTIYMLGDLNKKSVDNGLTWTDIAAN